MLEPDVPYPSIFSLNIVPRASKNINSYNPQAPGMKYNIAAEQTTTEEFVSNTTMFAGSHSSVESADITGQQVLLV